MPAPLGYVIRPVEIPRVPAPGLEESVSGTIPAEWHVGDTLPEDAPTVVYFHGGGYVGGSPQGHRAQTFALATRGLRVLSVDYRLGPENVYPGAITDAYSAWKWILLQGFSASKAVFSGDSAGGGLSYVTALYLRDLKEQMPAGLACITPYVDLSLVSPSHNLRQEFDLCILTKQALEHSTKRGYGRLEHDKLKYTPYYSPIYASVDKTTLLPPQL
ncbi:hypothetical protein HDU93_003360, partial [Gonapodya sp. JEL0774]